MPSVTVTPISIGYDGARTIYKIDLGSLGLSTIGSFAIIDDGVKSGGVGGASGADIDAVKISTNGTAPASQVGGLAGGNYFDFQNGVGFQPGYMTPWTEGKLSNWQSPTLFGTTAGNVYNSTSATLGSFDGDKDARDGSLSLGEGGAVSFSLTSAISVASQYLYIAEYGDQYQGIDHFKVVVSTEGATPISSQGLTLYGTWASDDFSLGRGNSAQVGLGNDYISGLDGNDLVFAWGGNDTVVGGNGSDTLYGELGDDSLLGGSGNDFMNGGWGYDKLFGDAGNDKLYGDAHNDFLVGGDGNDYLDGGYGDDKVYGGAGQDALRGGSGYDKLFGDSGNDKLYGDTHNDSLVGGTGNDYLDGGYGNDKIYGGAGKDALRGGSGYDAFVFDSKPNAKSNVDRIYDFNPKYDSIYLENSIFKVGKGTPSKPLKIKADFFTVGKSAADAKDRVIYDKSSGVLYYDSDGTGAKAMVKIALLNKGLKLTYNDFFAI